MAFSTEVLTGNPLEPYHHPRATVFFLFPYHGERTPRRFRRVYCHWQGFIWGLHQFYNIDKINPCGTTNYTPIRISCRDSYPTEKCTWLSRLPKKVNNGKRATRMKSAEGSYFRLIFLRQLSWDMLTPKCTNVIKHCTCTVKWASFGRYHQHHPAVGLVIHLKFVGQLKKKCGRKVVGAMTLYSRLVVDLPLLKNMSSSVGMMTFPTYGKS